MLQVIAWGRAELPPFDAERGRREPTRYLGPRVETWDRRFHDYLLTGPGETGTRWARIRTDRLVAKDLGFQPADG